MGSDARQAPNRVARLASTGSVLPHHAQELYTVDTNRLTAIIRSVSGLPSRREVLRGLIGTGAGFGAIQLQTVRATHHHHKSHKKKPPQSPSPPPAPPTTPCTPHCGRKVCGDDGCGGSCGSCPSGQFCRSGTCCTPEPQTVTCTANCGSGSGCLGLCGTVTSIGTCGQPVSCSCPSGQVCLGNGGCGQVCQDFRDCPGATDCNRCDASADGTHHCTDTTSCTEPACTSTADCPVGTQCQVTNCGPGGNEQRCVQLSFCPG